MKKTTLIIIGVIYVASIVFISLFGLKSMVLVEDFPVTQIICLNETTQTVTVSESNGKKVLKIKYEQPGNAQTLEGTMLQLQYRVLPDNATNKDVKFVYDEKITRATFYTDENGKQNGLILFTGVVNFNVKITSTDGTRIFAEVIVWAHA